MSFMDKIKNLVGKGKEAAGTLSGNDAQVFEGRADQVESDPKDMGPAVQDGSSK
jgi:uncharacterized protein YjbJ (UPF0337 family)